MYPGRILLGFSIRFFFGIVLGALLIYWQKIFLLNQVGFLEESTLKQLEFAMFQPRALFLFLLKRSLCFYLVLFLLATGDYRKRGIDLVCIVMGFMQGVFLAVAYMRFGRLGAWLYLTAQFPGGIAWLLCFFMIYAVCQISIDYHKLRVFGVGALLVTIGAWTQSYVNPFLLQKFLHVFFSKI